jgi:hypothetical protein
VENEEDDLLQGMANLWTITELDGTHPPSPPPPAGAAPAVTRHGRLSSISPFISSNYEVGHSNRHVGLVVVGTGTCFRGGGG